MKVRLTLCVVILRVPARLPTTQPMLARLLVAAAMKMLQSLVMPARSQEEQVRQLLQVVTTRQMHWGKARHTSLARSRTTDVRL